MIYSEVKNFLIDYCLFKCVFDMIKTYKRKYKGNLDELIEDIRTELEYNFKNIEFALIQDLNIFNPYISQYLIYNSYGHISTFYEIIKNKYWNKYDSNKSQESLSIKEVKDYLISFNRIKYLWDKFIEEIDIINYLNIKENTTDISIYSPEIVLNIYMINKK